MIGHSSGIRTVEPSLTARNNTRRESPGHGGHHVTAVLIVGAAALTAGAQLRHSRPEAARRRRTAAPEPPTAAGRPATPDPTRGNGTIGGVVGDGPFADGLHDTPAALWAAVALLLLSATLIGGAVVAASLDAFTARALLGASLPVGFLGLALARRHHIMSDVD